MDKKNLLVILIVLLAAAALLAGVLLNRPMTAVEEDMVIITIDGNIPSLQYHLLMLGWVVAMVGIGALIYKKCNHKFLYYV